MRAYASIQAISTDTLKGVFDNDEAETFWEGETEAPQTGDTPQVGEWAIPVHEQRTILKATQKVLEDADVNIEEWLINKGGAKMARAENSAFVTGNGVGRPRGFLDYPDGTDLTNSIERFQTGVSGDFAAAPDGTDVMRTMMASLKSNYRGNAYWFMNRTTEGEVLLLKDSDGRPLWQPSVQSGVPSSLMGRPIALFEDMPDTTAGALAMAYGDMRQGYQIVDRTGISILRDPFSYKPYVGFYMRKRVGGAVINGEALKILEFTT
jgi:HK97 family phage major capsid protein